ncbi:hypothetical protein CEXT_108391 [Caerostris extrusa]|uniref:Uncharacterized protein n=1 Tax=Caerostris extrusa TaxID=172846 RepID=A0AAV4SUM8_CAEEX|nr:hypothetical protein CEXT_108391 [Caerostris extrusa]
MIQFQPTESELRHPVSESEAFSKENSDSQKETILFQRLRNLYFWGEKLEPKTTSVKRKKKQGEKEESMYLYLPKTREQGERGRRKKETVIISEAGANERNSVRSVRKCPLLDTGRIEKMTAGKRRSEESRRWIVAQIERQNRCSLISWTLGNLAPARPTLGVFSRANRTRRWVILHTDDGS